MKVDNRTENKLNNKVQNCKGGKLTKLKKIGIQRKRLGGYKAKDLISRKHPVKAQEKPHGRSI